MSLVKRYLVWAAPDAAWRGIYIVLIPCVIGILTVSYKLPEQQALPLDILLGLLLWFGSLGSACLHQSLCHKYVLWVPPFKGEGPVILRKLSSGEVTAVTATWKGQNVRSIYVPDFNSVGGDGDDHGFEVVGVSVSKPHKGLSVKLNVEGVFVVKDPNAGINGFNLEDLFDLPAEFKGLTDLLAASLRHCAGVCLEELFISCLDSSSGDVLKSAQSILPTHFVFQPKASRNLARVELRVVGIEFYPVPSYEWATARNN